MAISNGRYLSDSLPIDFSQDVELCIAEDYDRLGRPEIAALFRNLSNKLLREEIFKIAHDKYIQTQDLDYGILLSICYGNGFGTEANEKEALQIDQSLMDRSVLALCSVANEYLRGVLLPKDLKKYHEFYAKALAQNKFFTPHTLWGYNLLTGNSGVEKNIEQGIALLEVATTNKQAMAAWLLASHFRERVLEKQYVTQDEMTDLKQKVYKYAKIAADLESPFGKYLLARCYSESLGVEQNFQQYLLNMHKSASLGCSSACFQLSIDYINGIEGILEIDFKQGLTFAFQSIRHNLSEFKDFAQFFEVDQEDNKQSLDQKESKEPLDRKQDPDFMEIAYKLCLQCLEGHLLDNPKDTAVMGSLYQKGIIVPQNIEMAFILFSRAAEQGDMMAAEALALLCTGDKDTAPSLPPSLAAELKGLVTFDVLTAINATSNHLAASVTFRIVVA